MRIKLYYPADEITNNLYTTGSEFMLETKKEYAGPYHKYITGEIYTESSWNASTSLKLVPLKQSNIVVEQYQKLKPSVHVNNISPTSIFVKLSTTDIKMGVIKRYFMKRYDSLNIIEVDAAQYKMWQSGKIDKNIYTAVMIDWFIAGPVNDTTQHGVNLPGVQTKNIKQIKYANTVCPGMITYLTNPLQFYTDTDFVVPKDINA
jgi:hypothetical protein